MMIGLKKLQATGILCAFVLTLGFSATSAYAQRELKDIPPPDPEIERSTFVVADGFEVNLYAADPLLAKPIQMNFDPQGRLWIASSEVYPQIKPGQKATDKILVLEDTDNDGVADKTEVFADGLFIPTGVAPGDGGVYVANSTDLVHYRDTDGDGKADRRQVVLSGFGTEDTHHLLHTLRWGPDGQLYMNQSIYIHSHIETPQGVKRLNGGGIWRFRPETLDLDVLAYGLVNSWGHHFDRYGQSFATDGAGGEGINYIFPGSVFFTAVGATRTVAGLNPGSPKHCGLEIVSGRHLPPEWQGNMITNDFRAHRVCRFVVTEDGSGYSSRQETELIKSTHVAFRPIDAKMGPDGAIYIADWYNPIIQHGEVDFRDDRRDHTHGRIWRVTAKGRPTIKGTIAREASVPQLISGLMANEEWVRTNAKLMLKERGPTDDVLRLLDRYVSFLDRASPEYEHHRLEALWAYQALNVPREDLLQEVSRSPDPRVRAAAVRVASQWRKSIANPMEYFSRGVADDHPRVRLESVRALADMPSLDAVQWTAKALEQPVDRWLDFAIWKTFRDLAPVWTPAVREGRFDFNGNVDHLTFALKAVDSPAVAAPLLDLVKAGRIPADRVPGVLSLVANLGGPGEHAALLEMLGTSESISPAGKASVLTAMIEASHLRRTKPAGDLASLSKLLESSEPSLLAAALHAAGAWKFDAARKQIADFAADESRGDTAERLGAIEALAAFGDEPSMDALNAVATSAKESTVRTKAVAALAPLKTDLAAAAAIQSLLQPAPAEGTKLDAAGLVAPILLQKTGAAALVHAVGESKLSPDVARVLVRAARGAAQPDDALIAALRNAGGLQDASWKLTPELASQLLDEAKTTGNATRGEQVYRNKTLQCQKCHAIGGAGGVVGPGLESIGASAQPDYLVESMLAPAAKVKEGFHTKQIATDEGQVYTGIVIRETDNDVILRTANDETITIAKNTIEERLDGRSLMPEGLLDELTREEVVDLIRFLSELGKVGDFAVGKSRVVRRFQTLVWTPETLRLLNRNSYDIAATENPAFAWDGAYSTVGGVLPVKDLPNFVIRAGNDPTAFVRFQVDVSTEGEIGMLLNDAAHVSAWVDGKPTPVTKDNLLKLAGGRHTITFSVNQTKREQPLRVELTDVPGSPAQAQAVVGK
jgi:putative heme-binding domain-containing protein